MLWIFFTIYGNSIYNLYNDIVINVAGWDNQLHNNVSPVSKGLIIYVYFSNYVTVTNETNLEI